MHGSCKFYFPLKKTTKPTNYSKQKECTSFPSPIGYEPQTYLFPNFSMGKGCGYFALILKDLPLFLKEIITIKNSNIS